MREYTEQERLELGIEIVAAMKASVYRVPIEDGRDMALDETEIDRIGYSTADLEEMEPDRRERLRAFAASRKNELHEQAMFVADAALKWMAGREHLYTKEFEDEIFAASDAKSDLGWSKDGYTVDESKVRHTFESVANTAFVNGAKWMYRRLTGNENA